MELTVNRLPAKTWNRLGVNEAAFRVEEPLQSFSPTVVKKPLQGSFCPDAGVALLPAEPLEGDLAPLLQNTKTALVSTKAGEEMKEPLVLQYRCRQNEKNGSRLVLHAGKDSTLAGVVVLCSEDHAKAQAALQIEIYAEENARVTLSLVQLMGRDSVCCCQICGTGKENAGITLTRLELGAKETYAGTVMDLQGEKSAFFGNFAYHGRQEQKTDLNYLVRHYGKKTASRLDVSGVLEEKAEKIFRGTIDFRLGSTGAKGDENEKVLLLGDELINKTVPLILCEEEDVVGNHGASIGRLDDKVLFYLASRGISPSAAKRMMAEAQVEAVCARIPDEGVRRQIQEFEEKQGAFNDEKL